MERRIIGAQNTSVKVGALTVLLFDGADVRILHNLDCNHILPRNDKVGHVELAPHESSLDTSQFVAVQIHVGFPVDTVEIEEQTILFEVFGQLEFVAIPEIGVEERFGDMQLVIGIIRFGYGAGVFEAAQYRSRNGGNEPVFRFVVGGRNLFARSCHFRRTANHPASARERHSPVCYGRSFGRVGHQSSNPHHFHLAQDIAVSVRCFLHQHTHVTSFIFFVEGDLVRQRLAAGKLGHIVPLLRIVGYLHFAANGFVNPA